MALCPLAESDARAKSPKGHEISVFTGAQMSVKLHCSGAGIRRIPLSSERQSGTTRCEVAQWRWRRAGSGAVA